MLAKKAYVVVCLAVASIVGGCLARTIIAIAGKKLSLNNINGPLGVRGRKSDNLLITKKLGWKPSQPLIEGIEKTYPWIENQFKKTPTH